MVNLGDNTDQIIAKDAFLHYSVLEMEGYIFLYSIGNGGLHFSVLEMEGCIILAMWTNLIIFFLVFIGLSVRLSVYPYLNVQ